MKSKYLFLVLGALVIVIACCIYYLFVTDKQDVHADGVFVRTNTVSLFDVDRLNRLVPHTVQE